jgi:prophage regulatory protein
MQINDLQADFEGELPKPHKLSPGASRWSEQAVVAWIADVRDGFEGKRRKFW